MACARSQSSSAGTPEPRKPVKSGSNVRERVASPSASEPSTPDQTSLRRRLEAMVSDRAQQLAEADTRPSAAELTKEAVSSTKDAISTANVAFMDRVNSLNTNYSKLFSSSNARKQKSQDRRKIERHSMLTFREVDDTLDKVIIKRDLFLWLKCLWLGTDYVIDQFLERELRYYPFHAMGELRQSSKLFRGMPGLVKGKPFPVVKGLSRMDAIAPVDVPCANPAVKAAAANGGQSAVGAAKEKAGAATTPLPRYRYDGKGEPKHSFGPSSFTRPTVVIISQLAHQEYNTEAEWMGAFNEYLSNQAKLGGMRCTDLITIRTIDRQSLYWMRRPVVRRYAEYLVPEQRRKAFVGHQVIRQFMADFDLRNFFTSYVFLVDSKGNVRWMTCGAIADSFEKKAFHDGINALEVEHYRAQGAPMPKDPPTADSR